jgi:hypothetical protein
MAPPGLVHDAAPPVAARIPARYPAGARAWLAAFTALAAGVAVLSSRYLFADSFYDLAAGRYIAQHGIPHQNVLTVASHGAPWVDQQWLAHLLYYAAWRAGGYPALAAGSAALITAGLAGLGALMLHRGVPPTRMFGWASAALVVCTGNLVIRAQSFGYPLFVATLWLILADSRAPRLRGRTWLIIPVLVLWANTHGSVLLGAAMTAGYAGVRVCTALRRPDRSAAAAYLLLAAAAAGSVLATPYGLGILGYYARFRGNPALTHDVVEWSRPSLMYPASWGFFAVLAAVAGATVVAWRRGARPDPVLAGLVLLLLALALTAVRNQAWFGFGGCLLAADTLARTGRPVPDVSAVFRRGMAGLLAAAALAGTAALAAEPDRQFESLVPVRAMDVAAALAAENPALRVLGDDWSGSPMLWLHPALTGRVGFDARMEQYTPAQLNSYGSFLFAHGPGWPQAADGYGLIVVSARYHQPLSHALLGQPAWRVAASTPDGVVFARRTGS